MVPISLMEAVLNALDYMLLNAGRKIKPIQQPVSLVILLLKVLAKLVLPIASPVMVVEQVIAITVVALQDSSTHNNTPPVTNASEDA